MRFLSLSRPWPWAIFDLPEPDAKRVENRVWPCHPSVVGQVLALHAALLDGRINDLRPAGAPWPAREVWAQRVAERASQQA